MFLCTYKAQLVTSRIDTDLCQPFQCPPPPPPVTEPLPVSIRAAPSPRRAHSCLPRRQKQMSSSSSETSRSSSSVSNMRSSCVRAPSPSGGGRRHRFTASQMGCQSCGEWQLAGVTREWGVGGHPESGGSGKGHPESGVGERVHLTVSRVQSATWPCLHSEWGTHH